MTEILTKHLLEYKQIRLHWLIPFSLIDWLVKCWPGILRAKTMKVKLMKIPNDDKQYYLFCRLKLLVILYGHFKFGTNQLKFNKSTWSFWANFEYQCNLQSNVLFLPAYTSLFPLFNNIKLIFLWISFNLQITFFCASSQLVSHLHIFDNTRYYLFSKGFLFLKW